MTFQPTSEQIAVERSPAKLLLVDAFAGATKTTTLVRYAEYRPDARILYLAFNRSIAEEARQIFPANVDCRTTHSLAFYRVGRNYEGKIADLRPNHLMAAYSIPVVVATFLVELVYSFLHSADEQLGLQHVPVAVPQADHASMLAMASRVWADMQDIESKDVPIPHDGYLKLFQLAHPDLTRRYTHILFDEVQDANPVTADLILRQNCTRVLVGDRHQQIYVFRGSVNAFDLAEASGERYERLSLTNTFRFGEGLAKVATKLLRGMKGERKDIVGRGEVPTRFEVDRTQPYAVICRTNAKIFRQAVNALGKQKVHFVGGVKNFPFSKLMDVYKLWVGQKKDVSDQFFRSFASFEALETYARESKDKEALSLIGVVREYKALLPRLVEQVTAAAVERKEDADIVLASAHKAKGLDFLQVVLGDDFDDLVTEEGEVRTMSKELEPEVNLLYVAMTRAREAIELNAQLEDYFVALAKNGGAQAAVAQDEPVAKPAAVLGSVLMGGSGAFGLVDMTQPVAAKAVSAPSSVAQNAAAAEPLDSRIEKAILRQGLLQASRLAAELGVAREGVVDAVVGMILQGRLSPLLFVSCDDITGSLRSAVGG